MYLASSEFAIMIMVLSYGRDVVPGNPFERQWALVFMLFGGCVYACVAAPCARLLFHARPTCEPDAGDSGSR